MSFTGTACSKVVIYSKFRRCTKNTVCFSFLSVPFPFFWGRARCLHVFFLVGVSDLPFLASHFSFLISHFLVVEPRCQTTSHHITPHHTALCHASHPVQRVLNLSEINCAAKDYPRLRLFDRSNRAYQSLGGPHSRPFVLGFHLRQQQDR